MKKFFDVKYDEKFWDIIKNNVDGLKEIDEWYQILNFNHNQKTAIEPELYTLIKEYLPPKIDKDTWSIWTTKILEVTKTKPKDLYMKLRFILTGRNYGPSMNEMLTLYSREEILKRIESNCD